MRFRTQNTEYILQKVALPSKNGTKLGYLRGHEKYCPVDTAIRYSKKPKVGRRFLFEIVVGDRQGPWVSTSPVQEIL